MTAVIFALAVLASAPYFEGLWRAMFPGAGESQALRGRVHHVVVVEAGYSMLAKTPEGGTRWDRLC